MGLDDETFWSLTPAQFDMLVRRKSKERENEDYKADRRAALISTILANQNRKKGSKPFKIDDFMPRQRKKTGWKQQLKMVELFNEAFGGKDLRH